MLHRPVCIFTLCASFHMDDVFRFPCVRQAGPLELPTRRELDRSFEKDYQTLATLTSPVFFSEAEDGSIKQVSCQQLGLSYLSDSCTGGSGYVEDLTRLPMLCQGLDNMYASTDRPILLIGNHQLLGLDMSFMIRQVLVERGRLMRGLTHPLIFADEAQVRKPGHGFMGETPARRDERGGQRDRERGPSVGTLDTSSPTARLR